MFFSITGYTEITVHQGASREEWDESRLLTVESCIVLKLCVILLCLGFLFCFGASVQTQGAPATPDMRLGILMRASDAASVP